MNNRPNSNHDDRRNITSATSKPPIQTNADLNAYIRKSVERLPVERGSELDYMVRIHWEFAEGTCEDSARKFLLDHHIHYSEVFLYLTVYPEMIQGGNLLDIYIPGEEPPEALFPWDVDSFKQTMKRVEELGNVIKK